MLVALIEPWNKNERTMPENQRHAAVVGVGVRWLFELREIPA